MAPAGKHICPLRQSGHGNGGWLEGSQEATGKLGYQHVPYDWWRNAVVIHLCYMAEERKAHPWQVLMHRESIEDTINIKNKISLDFCHLEGQFQSALQVVTHASDVAVGP